MLRRSRHLYRVRSAEQAVDQPVDLDAVDWTRPCPAPGTALSRGWESPPPGMAELELVLAEVPECEEVVDGVCADFVSEFVLEGPSGEIRFRTGPGGEWSQVLEPGTYTLRASGSDGCPSPGHFELHEGATHERSVVWPVRC